MRKGIATPEKNSGIKLALPVRTRTPLEAFQMLRQGQPIDIMAGYYEKEGMIEKDFYMMDKIEKLHKIAELKQREIVAKQEALAIQQEYNVQQQLINDEAKKASGEVAVAAPAPGPAAGPAAK